MAWIQEEGSYTHETWDTYDLVSTFVPTNNDAILNEIRNSLDQAMWCRRDFLAPRDRVLVYSWNRFASTVKHENRYMFSIKQEGDFYSDDIPVANMLDALGQSVKRARLTKILPKGTRFVRAREHDPCKVYTTASELGAPPRDKAIYSNRMSPAGIPMFYGADTKATAIAEIFTKKITKPRCITVATFKTTRPITVVDLTGLPPVPSLFDMEKRDTRDDLRFLKEFVTDLAKAVVKDGREHIVVRSHPDCHRVLPL